ncbi:hypothetical protein GDO86_012726 [Hymenochirus boettgeri]|uniref:Uncharacterized protein n=1 Tax=Hymenochirus boettgeri TaxID=247094 RepID=A0A8T2INF7_9PIPI|nr:hypothetical protein GDO86_012726 [Hymenochirus boettgeri]
MICERSKRFILIHCKIQGDIKGQLSYIRYVTTFRCSKNILLHTFKKMTYLSLKFKDIYLSVSHDLNRPLYVFCAFCIQM